MLKLFLYTGTIEEVTASLFPSLSIRPHYLAGVTSHGVYTTGSFSVMHAGFGSTTIGAVLRPGCETISKNPIASIPEVSRYLAQQIVRAPVLAAKAVTPSNLVQAQLEKLIINAMINPLTAIFNCSNGQLFVRRPISTLMQLLLTEASAVVRALSSLKDNTVRLHFSQPRLEKLVRSVAMKTGNNISSMLQDVRAGRKTEIDYINGYIVARGADLGIDCIHNRTLVQMVKDKRVISESQISAFFFLDMIRTPTSHATR